MLVLVLMIHPTYSMDEKLIVIVIVSSTISGGWADDQLNEESKYDSSGNIIGVQADSKVRQHS